MCGPTSEGEPRLTTETGGTSEGGTTMYSPDMIAAEIEYRSSRAADHVRGKRRTKLIRRPVIKKR